MSGSLGALPGTLEGDGWRLTVRRLGSDAEARACAELMASSEPWRTLGRDVDASYALVRRDDRETWVAADEAGGVIGFVVLSMRGAFVGYVQSVAVRPEWRSRGVGSRLLAFAEARVFRESPHVFLLTSSFNPRARVLYERLGYRYVGTLRDYLVRGHDEHLMWKSLGPLAEYAGGFAGSSGRREALAERSSDGSPETSSNASPSAPASAPPRVPDE